MNIIACFQVLQNILDDDIKQGINSRFDPTLLTIPPTKPVTYNGRTLEMDEDSKSNQKRQRWMTIKAMAYAWKEYQDDTFTNVERLVCKISVPNFSKLL